MKRSALKFATTTLLVFSISGACSADKMITLDGGQGLRATVSPANGGELAGLEIRHDGRWYELLYRGRDYAPGEGWRGKAPFLWPAVGPTIDPRDGRKGFRVDGTFYPMPPHGFARDRAWRVRGERRDGQEPFVVLVLSSDERTRQHYPFDFDIEVTYRVAGKRLELTYTVRADGGNSNHMPFSIGNHITFKAPMLAGAKPGAVRFYNDFPDRLLRDPDRTFSGRVVPSPYRGEHPVSALPHRAAVSLGGSEGLAELTVIDPSGLSIRLSHAADREPGAPSVRFNLWADLEEGFFSPEPWLGTQNSLNNGAGLIHLAPGESWRWRLTIEPGWSPPVSSIQQDETP